MNIIRFYDDSDVIVNQIPLKELLKGKYVDWNVEYCTYKDNDNDNKEKIRKVWKFKESSDEKVGWDLIDGNEYYVFLDTRWNECTGIIPEDVKCQLVDDKIKMVYVYTRFDESAAEELKRTLEKDGIPVCGVEKIYVSRPTDSLSIIKMMLEEMCEE